MKINIGLGEDERAKFIQHTIELNGTITEVTRHYYEVIDEQTVVNMPQEVLDEVLKQLFEERERRELVKHPNARMSDRQHLRFIWKRLVYRHKENPNYDYMIRFTKIIEEIT